MDLETVIGKHTAELLEFMNADKKFGAAPLCGVPMICSKILSARYRAVVPLRDPEAGSSWTTGVPGS